MKRSLLATSALISLVLPVLVTSCALEEAPPPVAGGGKSGSGGTSGGSSGSGGSVVGGSAGTVAGGTGGSAGSVAGGTGGSAGSAGSAGSSGSAGSGGSGGGSEPITVDTLAGGTNEFGFAWKDSFFLVPCYSVSGVDCLVVNGECPNQDAVNFEEKGFTFKERFPLGGEAGKNYDVSIKVSGIVEGKHYSGGTRQRGDDSSNANDPAGTDTFHVGGTAIPSNYNVYKMTVFAPDGTTEVGHYYMNSYPAAFTDAENHQTFPIAYEGTVEVPGGGFVEYLIQDSNCRAINNCGVGDNGNACPNERALPNDPVAVPTMYGGQTSASMNVVNGSTGPWHAQMIHLTVTNVVEK